MTRFRYSNKIKSYLHDSVNEKSSFKLWIGHLVTSFKIKTHVLLGHCTYLFFLNLFVFLKSFIPIHFLYFPLLDLLLFRYWASWSTVPFFSGWELVKILIKNSSYGDHNTLSELLVLDKERIWGNQLLVCKYLIYSCVFTLDIYPQSFLALSQTSKKLHQRIKPSVLCPLVVSSLSLLF